MKIFLVNIENFNILITFANLKHAAFFKMTKMECKIIDKTVLRQNVCRLKAVKRDVTEATIRIHLLREVDNCNVTQYEQLFISLSWMLIVFMLFSCTLNCYASTTPISPSLSTKLSMFASFWKHGKMLYISTYYLNWSRNTLMPTTRVLMRSVVI